MDQIFLDFAFAFSGMVLVVHDAALTFSRELECIWKYPFSPVTAIYIAQRYVLLVSLTENLPGSPVPSLVIPGISDIVSSQQCQIISGIYDTLAFLNIFSTSLFSLLRVWAISGDRRWKTVAVLFPFAVVSPSLAIYTFSQQRTTALSNGTCDTHWVAVPQVSRASAIMTDLGVIVVTWLWTRESLKLSLENPLSSRPKMLSTILFRNGETLLALNTANLILDFHDDYALSASSFIDVNSAIAANLICRFILDLRTQAAGPTSVGELSSARFASFAGNIGGQGDSMWLTSADHDQDYSEDPPNAEISAVEISHHTPNDAEVGVLVSGGSGSFPIASSSKKTIEMQYLSQDFSLSGMFSLSSQFKFVNRDTML
ncbi:hypothetical protein BXZ70DRAFT_946917 [Cristinia sonorae]|uniref:DUF6533 domain-containing protein n=1 Tax=Cristinia sonorae TaxID=1940300 RepID=A0A8K0UKN6_9AGAR|nr:hypothetical protein BXZ70DRAFT_946917 [Cristinia sonorae]